ncbi:MAG: hypothetical protein HeimC3_29970 [Candidatus Heimdallarchaeota archaeon LC_3]|nr:MAG: hypothetical protein HeimC3_29970 [Candidatus Heimdallarchaeota archaeon LC_3]
MVKDMRPSGHFYSGLIFWFILFILNNSYSYYNTFFFITAVIVLDLDYLGKFIFVEQNHRRYLSHSPVLWSLILIGAFFFQNNLLFWISLGFLVHVLVDTIDWGIFLLPTKNARITPHLLEVHESMKIEKDFSRVYWNNKVIFSIEVTLFLITTFVIIYLTILSINFYLLVYLSAIFVITSSLSFIDYKNSID